MAVIRNAANTLKVGKVGETTYYVARRTQIARQALNSSNYGETASRTELQQSRRVRWSNLVQFYKSGSAFFRQAFETKKVSQTDYNKFMSVNVNNANIYLTRDEAEQGACVAVPVVLSQGSLPSIEVIKDGQQWRSNISVGELSIDNNTTVAAFSEALVGANGNIEYGQQLSFVSYQQTSDALGTPRVVSRMYEVTLSKSNNNKLRDYMPEFAASVVNGFLGTGGTISVGVFCWVLSQIVNSKLLVSTQYAINNNTAMIAQYSSTEQRDKAILSYGLSSESRLNPRTLVSQEAEAQPVFLSEVFWGNTQLFAGQYAGTAADFANKVLKMTFSNISEAGVGGVLYIYGPANHLIVFDDGELSADGVLTKTPITTASNEVIEKIAFEFNSGETYSWTFPAENDMV